MLVEEKSSLAVSFLSEGTGRNYISMMMEKPSLRIRAELEFIAA